MGAYLGIDYGSRRVGLATADAEAKLAAPVATVAPEQLLEFITGHGPFDVIVVGLPRGLDGRDTQQTTVVRRFVADKLEGLGVPLAFQDEAGTSSVAEARLREAGRPYRQDQIDAEAAAIILQDYLETLA
jgi:putative Holliday junction resolvase